MIKEKLKKWILAYKWVWLAVAVMAAAEALFDVAEILVGQVMKGTNALRPKTGRLWLEEEKDLAGQQQVLLIVDSLSNNPFRSGPLNSLEELTAYLHYKNFLRLQREDFLSLYQALPDSDARRLVDAQALAALMSSSAWQSVNLISSDGQMTLIFNDSNNQPLLVTQPFAPPPPEVEPSVTSQLQQDGRFSGRLVEPAHFLAAYQRLPRRLQLQVINDPAFMEKKAEEWVMVAIAASLRSGSVTLACEVREEQSSVIHTFQASELAIGYLIQEINVLRRGAEPLALPSKETTP
ncbi:MAG TPA: hypothetical protein PK843_09130 [bacterium]|nr:hypothetical protein [bacterium]